MLIEYSPEKFISKFVAKKNQDRFYKRVFKEQEWQDLDRGTLEYNEAIKFLKRKREEAKTHELERIGAELRALMSWLK